jgi:hypothetical protein
MSIVPYDVQCFDVERSLAKALGIKVETFVCGPTEFKLRIGLRWNLILDGEQLEALWQDTDNTTALRDRLDTLKPTCLVFQSLSR